MAFTAADQAAIRKRAVRYLKGAGLYRGTQIKPEVNAAIDAVFARLDGSRSIIGADIETAAPGAFNAAEKAAIFAFAAERFGLNEVGS